MRIATWNVNSLKVRLPRLEEWLAYADADVVCLQETKVADTAFPAMAFKALGYDSAHAGEGRWNGVAILSRVGLDDVVAGFTDGDEPDGQGRLLWATCNGVRVGSVYVPNGRSLVDEQFGLKLEFLSRLRASLDVLDPSSDVVVCGDWNIAPTDADVWDPDEYQNSTHVSPPERQALEDIAGWGLVDVFRLRQPENQLFTWWDYRAGMFHKHRGMRIDLVMASRSLADRARFATIDRNARKGKLPSDHAPVLVDFGP